MAGAWHQFKAPIDGKAVCFVLRCIDGRPNGLFCTHPGCMTAPRLARLVRDLCDLNMLLRAGRLDWEVMKLHRQGDLGAVIEAAEVRRAEIYGGEVAA